MSKSDDRPSKIDQQHIEAVQRGDQYYIDPTSGLLVMTELYHQARGTCCESDCRHCPYR